MPKLNLDELDESGRFLFIASIKISIGLSDNGFDKNRYLTWCSEVWDTVKLNGKEKMNEFIAQAIHNDLNSFLKKFEEQHKN